jgi:hypothetical protein
MRLTNSSSLFEAAKTLQRRDATLHQILGSHHEGPPDDGLSYCQECRWHWPCPPVILATSVRDLIIYEAGR